VAETAMTKQLPLKYIKTGLFGEIKTSTNTFNPLFKAVALHLKSVQKSP